MSPYITFRDVDNENKLRYYILQREYPHYVGVLSEKPEADPIGQGTVAKYNLWVIFAGTLRGNFIPAYQDVKKELSFIYQNMADWYYENRILKDESRYKKFKITTNDTIPVK